MLVSKSFETPEGTVKFEGELEPLELDFIIKIGLNYLMTHGAFTVSKEQINAHKQDTDYPQ